MKLINKLSVLLVSLFVPMFIACMMLLDDLENNLMDNILDSVERQSENIIETLNIELEEVYMANSVYLVQKDIVKLDTINLGYSRSEYFDRINNIRQQLESIVVATSLVESAAIYYNNLDIVLNSSAADKVSYTLLGELDYEKVAVNLKRSTICYYENPISNKMELSILLATQAEHSSFILELVLDTNKLKAMLEAYDVEKYILKIGGYELNNLTVDELDDFTRNYTNADLKEIELNGHIYFSDTLVREYGDMTLIVLQDLEEEMKYMNQINNLFSILLILIFVAFIIFIKSIISLIHKPLVVLRDAFIKLESGDFNTQLNHPTSYDFVYLYDAFNRMVKNVGALITREYENEILIQKSELRQLQAQINPHFFYNSFFILKTMIKSENIEEAERLALLMGEYFEYLTKNSDEYVALEQEYRHCKIYLDIQLVRFGNRINVELGELSVVSKKVKVPKLILQPIIENIFNHGLINKEDNGILRIEFLEKEKEIMIVLEDNGEELSDDQLLSLQEKLVRASERSKDMEMTGIYNIHRRLMIYSDSHSSISLSRSELGGLCTSITILY